MRKLKHTLSGLAAMMAAAMFSLTVFAEGETATADPTLASAGQQLLLQMLPFVIALVLLYLVLLRPQQKREKQAQAMRDNVRVGDEVCTAGGIVGIVLKVEEETVVIETGMERNKIRIKKWAIHENITQMEEAQQAEKERKAARQKGIATAAATQDKQKKKKDE